MLAADNTYTTMMEGSMTPKEIKNLRERTFKMLYRHGLRPAALAREIADMWIYSTRVWGLCQAEAKIGLDKYVAGEIDVD